MTTLLLILDGWGYRSAVANNAIALAQTPNWDSLCRSSPHTYLEASGPAVGLPVGQMGNSEVGHMTIGAGRCPEQSLTRIQRALNTGSFGDLPLLRQHSQRLAETQGTLHLFGLLSDGGIHAHIQHWEALLEQAQAVQIKKVFLHVCLDGRDTSPKAAQTLLPQLLQICARCGVGEIASMQGRFYGMDRDHNWQRSQQGYEALMGRAPKTDLTPLEVLRKAYLQGQTDEFISPICFNQAYLTPHDTLITVNFRADRMQQIMQLVTQSPHRCAHIITMTDYGLDSIPHVLFPAQRLSHTLGHTLAAASCRQLRLAETEKYAHVTYFFNGGNEAYLPGETRKMLPSAKVSQHDAHPQMQAFALTAECQAHLLSKKYDFILCNLANADMVGHTGNLQATITAIEVLDTCLGLLRQTAIATGSTLLITADHGNAEYMFDPVTQQPHTAHTTALVPFVIANSSLKVSTKLPRGTLCDIAPTILHLLGLPAPAAMTGKSLIQVCQLTK